MKNPLARLFRILSESLQSETDRLITSAIRQDPGSGETIHQALAILDKNRAMLAQHAPGADFLAAGFSDAAVCGYSGMQLPCGYDPAGELIKKARALQGNDPTHSLSDAIVTVAGAIVANGVLDEAAVEKHYRQRQAESGMTL